LVDDPLRLPYDGIVSRIAHQGFRWEVAPQFESLLAEVLREPGEPVKISSASTVVRRRVANREFYIKRYLHERRGLAPLAYFIRSDKSRREWAFAPQFQARGIPVVPHLAHGERWGWYGLLESVLITEGLPGYAPLLALPDPRSGEAQFALGQFLRQMHDAGIVYLDISPKNVLYSASEGKFCLIDVDKAELHDTLTERQRIDHISVFHSRFPLTAAFHDGYGSDMARHASRIEQQASAMRQAFIAGVSRRCLKHRHEVATRRRGGLTWHIRLSDLDANLERILQHPDSNASNAAGFAVNRLAFHSGKEAYRRSYRRELSGESAPRPVAAADKRVLGFVVRGYLVTKTP
jgi:tRNA A-37 threonylcarbamoyl transferase component Bud32